MQTNSAQIIFPKVTIIGVGLIGGSLGLALKTRGMAEEVVGVARTADTLRRALERGAIDRAESNLARAVQQADLVYLATPVGAVTPLLDRVLPVLKPGALVTDAASVKGTIVRAAGQWDWGQAGFIGGHPMAGSERSGIQAADADLFVNAAYVLTPSGLASEQTLQRLVKWIETLGSRVYQMDAGVHDRAVALVSHLPHVLALSLMQVALQREAEGGPLLEIAAGSFRDATRVAMSDPELWTEIAVLNRDALLESCREFEGFLHRLQQVISDAEITTFLQLFQEAGEARRHLVGPQDETCPPQETRASRPGRRSQENRDGE